MAKGNIITDKELFKQNFGYAASNSLENGFLVSYLVSNDSLRFLSIDVAGDTRKYYQISARTIRNFSAEGIEVKGPEGDTNIIPFGSFTNE